MRTQLSIVVVAAGIVGTITAGTVSANVLMNHHDVASMTAASAPSAAPVTPETEPVMVQAAPEASAPVRTKAEVTRTVTAPKAATTSATKAPLTYVVKPGDDLSSIAQWFALHGYADLFKANRGVIGNNPDLILPGERITISGGRMSVR